MRLFLLEYLILLSKEELMDLLRSADRESYQPDLSRFLHLTKNLEGLRELSYPPSKESWKAPELLLYENNQILNHEKIRGIRYAFPLPVKPGETQLALCHDWFWTEFCIFLCKQKIWAYKTDTEWIVIVPEDISFSAKESWKEFWALLSSREYLPKSMGLYLDHKSIFKQQASAWCSENIPILSSEMAQYLLDYYQHGKRKKKLFKEESIYKAIEDIEKRIQKNQYDSIPFPEEKEIKYTKGGDFYLLGRQKKALVKCASCGEVIFKEEGRERIAVLLKDADERPQSGKTKDDKNLFCNRCVATVMLCPIKLTSETLAIKFIQDGQSSSVSIPLELRKFVAYSLHILAGEYVALHIEEFLQNKALKEIWGSYHYALWKISSTFPPELFAQNFRVKVYPGESQYDLPAWALWFLSSLRPMYDIAEYQCWSDDKYKNSFSHFLRLLSQGKIFQSFYTLISGNILGKYIFDWKINQLQNIWSQMETILAKEHPMPIPDYPRIAGMAGLLLPLAERIQFSKKQETEKERAIKKLLEEVDRPIQYAYTASRESGTSDFIFCKRPRNSYFFEKALDLLREAGENPEELLKEAEKNVNENEAFAWAKDSTQKIILTVDKIIRVTSALIQEGTKPYANEADWRAFSYQVKLALWSMFPQYLSKE